MTPEELRRAVETLDARRAADALTLEQRVRAELSALPACLAELASGSDPVLVARARSLIAGLGSSAAAPLLDSAVGRSPEQEVWRLGTLAAAAVGLRGLVGERLRACLGDRRPVPLPPADEPVEERPVPRRVCDEAYLLLRELMATGESRSELVMESRLFLRAPETDRDAEITRITASSPFARLTEDLEA